MSHTNATLDTAATVGSSDTNALDTLKSNSIQKQSSSISASASASYSSRSHAYAPTPLTSMTSMSASRLSKSFIPDIPIQPKQVRFSYLSEAEILKLSVKRITNSINFSTLGNPIPGGLYDPALGPNSDDRTKSVCTTCGLFAPHCPGHIGHIALPVPVFNPTLFKYLLRILRWKCIFCHNLRLSRFKARYFTVKLLLLKAGLYDLAASLEEDVLGKNFANVNSTSAGAEESENETPILSLDSNKKKNKKNDENKNTATPMRTLTAAQDNLRMEEIFSHRESQALEELGLLDALEEMNKSSKIIDQIPCMGRIEQLNQLPEKLKERLHITTHCRTQIRNTIKEFQDSLKSKTCANCGARAPNIVGITSSKIYRMPLPPKIARVEARHGRIFVSALKKSVEQRKKESEFLKEQQQNRSRSNSNVSDVAAAAFASTDNEILEEDAESIASAMSKEKRDEDDIEEDVNEGEEEDDEDDDGEVKKKKASSIQDKSSSAAGNDSSNDKGKEKGSLMHALEIFEQLKRLWKNEGILADLLWGQHRDPKSNLPGYHTFFLNVVVVPPSRFRPAKSMGGMILEHHQTTLLSKILKLATGIESYFLTSSVQKQAPTEDRMKSVINDWNTIQSLVNSIYDGASKSADDETQGIRQVLDKKQGLFRQNLMGKRVNFAARSVISPDPYIGTDEVGVPVRFAKELMYPEPITEMNKRELAQMVRNGPTKHPGAVFVEDDRGNLIDLGKQSKRQRDDLAVRIESIYSSSLQGEANNESSNDDVIGADGSAISKFQTKSALKKIYRHMRSGDVMLANRQPTLHKASIMAHKVRVIDNASMQTIRLHYANCNSYNADFDGDEINLHLPQNEIARAEAFEVAYTDYQYCSPTNGEPLRGLIQDHVAMGVILTKRDTFLNREEFSEMLFIACEAMNGPSFASTSSSRNSKNLGYELPIPAIMLGGKNKSKGPLWTGKQLISSILKRLVVLFNPNVLTEQATITNEGSDNEEELSSKSKKKKKSSNNNSKEKALKVNRDFLITLGPLKAKTPPKAWDDPRGSSMDGLSDKEKQQRLKILEMIGANDGPLSDGKIIFRKGEYCTGVLDKSQLGDAKFGLVHCIYELYGAQAAGQLLSAFGRLFTLCTQKWAHTCGIEDLLLTRKSEELRAKAIRTSVVNGIAASAKFSGFEVATEELQGLDGQLIDKIASNLHGYVRGSGKSPDKVEAALDSYMQQTTSITTSEILKDCLPLGQFKLFPLNSFSLMVLTGAKGSLVNHSQISCALGQQALEGRRVPRMASGKTLPCFAPFDPTPRSGGFISDRFLTGVRPQEYYFHCMAGREGLVDTAVKTSRSGYLQRCLVKNLESLSVSYDRTIRSSDGSIVQFLYGGDGLDPLETQYLNGSDENFKFYYENAVMALEKNKLSSNIQTNTSSQKEHDIISESLALVSTSASSNDEAKNKFKVGSIVSLKSKGKGAWTGKIIAMHKHSGEEPLADIELLGYHSNTKQKANKKHHVPIKDLELTAPDPVIFQYDPDTHLGAINEKLQESLDNYIKRDPHHFFIDDKSDNAESKKQLLRKIIWSKYMRALAAPGESVGALAAQGIGEPSTQMTLNTFHLAGHGAGNVTLGIPRLRELIMVASANIQTPTMTMSTLPNVAIQQAMQVKNLLYSLKLSEILRSDDGITIKEMTYKNGANVWRREYMILLNMQSLDTLSDALSLGIGKIKSAVGLVFLPKLLALIRSELRRSGTSIESVRVKGKGRSWKKSKPTDEEVDGLDEENGENDDGEEGGKKGSNGKKSSSVGKNKKKSNELDEGEAESGSDEESEKDSSVSSADSSSSDDEEEGEKSDDDNDNASSRSSKSISSNPDDSDGENESKSVDGNDKAALKKKIIDYGNKNEDGDEIMVSTSTQQTACYISSTFQSSNPDAPFAKIILDFPATEKKILMLGLAEQATVKTIVRNIDGIQKAYVNENEKTGGYTISTDGCNLKAAWELPYVNPYSTKSNDVAAVSRSLGIEAARSVIVDQLTSVFDVYGIDIDPRHLGLVADWMTFEGDYRPFNRRGIEVSTSPLLRISFETSTSFLVDAAFNGEHDTVDTPSSQIALGQLITCGTGCFELRASLPSNKKMR